MSRYIDADKFVRSLEKQSYYSKANIEIRISKMSTADVAPVVHAHWELYHDETNITYGSYTCTNCKTIQGLAKYRYCPYCGAKMDEEE